MFLSLAQFGCMHKKPQISDAFLLPERITDARATLTSQPDLCDHVWAPFAVSVTTTVVAVILSIITATGNLKSLLNYLVLNLAIADSDRGNSGHIPRAFLISISTTRFLQVGIYIRTCSGCCK